MRLIYSFLAILALSLPATAGEPDKILHLKCIYPTVKLALPSGTGSGVIVRCKKVDDHYENIVFTVAHNVYPNDNEDTTPEAPEVRAPIYKDWSTLATYNTFSSSIARVDRNKDICVLRFKSIYPTYVADTDFNAKLYIGNSLFHTGYGGSEDVRIDHGQVTALRTPSHKVIPAGAFRTSIFTVNGDSGGPVFEDHRVVALTQSMALARYEIHGIQLTIPIRNVSFAVPLKGNFTPDDLRLPGDPPSSPAPKTLPRNVWAG